MAVSDLLVADPQMVLLHCVWFLIHGLPGDWFLEQTASVIVHYEASPLGVIRIVLTRVEVLILCA